MLRQLEPYNMAEADKARIATNALDMMISGRLIREWGYTAEGELLYEIGQQTTLIVVEEEE